MKKFIYSTAIFLTVMVSSAQSLIIQAEYFWDTDPGMGFGTPVLAVDGNLNSAFENLIKTGITLPPVGLHVFNIRIRDNVNGWGPVFRNVISIQTTLEVDDFETSNELKAFPNPVSDILNISFYQAMDSVVIYNLLGQEVLTKSINANETSIDVSQLPQGTYLVKVNSGDAVKTIKIIKQ